MKREFVQAVASKAFVIGTILGPLLIFGIFAIQFLIIAKGGGGEHAIAIVDATGRDLGARVARAVEERAASGPSFIARATYELEQQTAAPGDFDAVKERLTERIVAKELDGFLWLPPGVMSGEAAQYEGSNATNSGVTGDVRQAVQRVVQSDRLRNEGIDESRLGAALTPVPLDVRKTGALENPMVARLLAMAMAFSIYIVVLMYGQSIMASVQEEKRDRIVELILSSVRARDLLIGKVVVIGAAGVLQMLIWVSAAALLLTYGGEIASLFGASAEMVQAMRDSSILPSIPLSVGITFVLFFAGGFFLFATMFAVIGAIVTTTQEAQQFVFPILMPFIIGLFIAMQGAENPDGTVTVIGSLVPFTSPMVMPVRASVSDVSIVELGLSIALLYVTAMLMIWLAAKIYRTAIFATGKKPSMRELMRWMRAA
jgi:ABC-2 type transport system permease protein